MEPSVRLIPLGGLGEIGLNMMLIESGDDIVAVDCGLMFPDDELPGVDYVIPDFSYALAKRERFHGVVLTHGHEDHIGALPYLLKSAQVPVYATPLTRAFVADKLREHALPEAADLRPMRPREPFTLGPFAIEAIRVTHPRPGSARRRRRRSRPTPAATSRAAGSVDCRGPRSARSGSRSRARA